MTCISAVVKDGKVYMGGDSGGVDTDGGTIALFNDKKVFIRKGYLIGYAGSYTFGKFLQHVFDLPDLPPGITSQESIEKFVNGVLMPSLRKQSKSMDLTTEELDFECLIGVKGHLFLVSNDWVALEPTSDFMSVGSGQYVAIGSLHTTQTWKDPVKRINASLTAAEQYCTSVLGPFTILSK
jgi:ATP-dependent protease HslVU (ClpYQ) peptidase subunit